MVPIVRASAINRSRTGDRSSEPRRPDMMRRALSDGPGGVGESLFRCGPVREDSEDRVVAPMAGTAGCVVYVSTHAQPRPQPVIGVVCDQRKSKSQIPLLVLLVEQFWFAISRVASNTYPAKMCKPLHPIDTERAHSQASTICISRQPWTFLTFA